MPTMYPCKSTCLDQRDACLSQPFEQRALVKWKNHKSNGHLLNHAALFFLGHAVLSAILFFAEQEIGCRLLKGSTDGRINFALIPVRSTRSRQLG